MLQRKLYECTSIGPQKKPRRGEKLFELDAYATLPGRETRLRVRLEGAILGRFRSGMECLIGAVMLGLGSQERDTGGR